jgi:hypothetical protein
VFTALNEMFFLDLINHSPVAMDDKMFDHLRASTDAKYIKSLKELFMDFYGKAKTRTHLGGFNSWYEKKEEKN